MYECLVLWLLPAYISCMAALSLKTMRVMRYLLSLIVPLLLIGPVASAQDDGRIVFKDPKSPENEVLTDEELSPKTHAWGLDLMIGNDGFGLGVFYHHLLNDVVTAFATCSFSEARDVRQIDFVNYWTGAQWSPNKVNRVFRVPLFVGVQYRLFAEDITDNFRPYVQAGAGPVMLYITPAEKEFFSSLTDGFTKYTYGGFVGAGAQFGFDRSSVFGLNLRYMIIPTPKGIQSVQEGVLANANGFFIAINLGISF